MSPLPRIRVTRETHATPAAIAERITRAGGTNRYGEPNFRVVWGGARLTWIGGRWTDRDAHGNVSREAIELRQVPKYLPVDRWHIERWMPPEFYGSPDQWRALTSETEDGIRIPALGPYPARGDYEHCFTLQSSAGEFEPLNAACRAPSSGGGGSVFFRPPPLYYKVLQPQLPSTSPVFSTPSGFCWGLHLLGGTVGEASQLQQFNFAPMVAINVTAGASPNTAPVFALPGFTTIENLSIQGSNQAVSLYDSVNVLFRNVCLAVNGATGQTDNTPLKITNSIWVRYTGGCLMAKTSATTPIALFTGETPIAGEAPLDGLITIEDVNAAGGGIQYIQRVNQSGTAGNFVFRNITLEDASTDVFTFSALPGVTMGPFDSMTFDHVNTSDEPIFNSAALTINAPTLTVSGVFMNHVFTGNGPAGGAVAVREISGRADNIFITKCNSLRHRRRGRQRQSAWLRHRAKFQRLRSHREHQRRRRSSAHRSIRVREQRHHRLAHARHFLGELICLAGR
jgi:hypothetical protein